jgi:aerobic carbon-monoxide dehydrogenase large subunit
MSETALVERFREIGKPVRRKEDRRLVTGQGAFTDDVHVEGQAYAVMVRSPYPHAKIVSIDKASVRDMPGVLLVVTGQDCRDAGMTGIPHNPIPKTDNDLKLRGPGDSDIFIGPQIPLPTDRARHVGEAVAMIVAETRFQALDAAETLKMEFEELPWIADTAAAAEPGAPVIWDEVPENTPVDTEFGDVASTEAAFIRADHVVRMAFHVDRVTGVPLEPRSALAVPDPETGRITLYAGSGGAVRQKGEIAQTLGMEPDRLRVISNDVGGNFGTRNRVYVEFPLVTFAAMTLQRPVKYTCERIEAFLSDYQGRDLVTRVALALDKDGTFLAMRADNISNVGARIVSLSPLGKGSALITGNYHIPVACIRARAVFSNTVPTQAYRSSGRPEVTFAIERLIETAAAEFGFDPIELRRRNLIRPDQMPYLNPIGATYDSGDYARNMAMAMRLADWDGFPARRAEAEARGVLLGRGFCNYVESSTGSPVEQAVISVYPQVAGKPGSVDVIIGTQPSGQGHETSFAQVAADWLGLPVDRVNIVLGDTDVVKLGGGSHSGRSMRMAGTVIVQAADDLIAKGKRVAAVLLDAPGAEVAFDDGVFSVVGTNKALGLFELAAAVESPDVQERLPDDLKGKITATRKNEMHAQVFPNGAQICEIEIDPETGAMRIARYIAIDDVGRAINPLIVEGQTHGGVVQGVGQAMREICVVDPRSGQPVCGSFMDYGMPRADDFPMFETALNEVPSPTNPLGIKAGGEGGTTGALAAVVNAVVDALRPYGVRDMKMPVTPLKVWQAIHGTGPS